ncbi:Uncharacterized protein OBRU01_09676 [Operophtera brumata]|uniref:Uncharacterized protein n=1 Tax=Operophtera brumata TaxID=104452 RepID=A0A0L7LF56_OPEBR|nr:Uncharacterized protein OBRU01_09676 [Operophtera brumata]
MNQNIAGALNKQDELDLVLQTFEDNNEPIDILCLSETFIERGYEIGGATCSICAATFHKACVLIQGSVSSGWVCPGCKVNQKRGDNIVTPVKNLCESSFSTSAQVTPQAPAPVLNIEMQEMRLELAEHKYGGVTCLS